MILPCVERGREAGLPSNLPIDGHSFRRVVVLTGAPRRRRWSAAEKAAIVTESLLPGAVARTVALRYGLHRNQLYMWRRELRSGALASPGMVITAGIEIEIGGVVLRAGAGVDLAFLSKIVRLLKAT